MYLTTDQSVATQTKVANYAYDTYLGQAYNYLFISNKLPDGFTIKTSTNITYNLNPADRTNCSELVWGAYKKKSGLDLDGSTGGAGDVLAAYPWDIDKSSHTTRYTP
ncbi:hypothetical protein [Micropruina sp.]|uniref:hypothetical protein n=1 Tax=Micropruina sp. TaxID=2737536 RepID=UPI0039E38F6F